MRLAAGKNGRGCLGGRLPAALAAVKGQSGAETGSPFCPTTVPANDRLILNDPSAARPLPVGLIVSRAAVAAEARQGGRAERATDGRTDGRTTERQWTLARRVITCRRWSNARRQSRPAPEWLQTVRAPSELHCVSPKCECLPRPAPVIYRGRPRGSAPSSPVAGRKWSGRHALTKRRQSLDGAPLNVGI